MILNNPTIKIRAFTENIYKLNNELILRFRIEINNTDLYIDDKYNLCITKRNSYEELELDCEIIESDNSKIILQSKLEIEESLDLIKNYIGDIYIINKNKCMELRVSATEFNCENSLYSRGSKKRGLRFYKTLKGNLSIRKQILNDDIRITSIDLKTNGTLRINGTFNPERLELENSDDINLAIKIKGSNKENNNCNTTIIKKENGSKLIDYKFTLECNILDLEFKSNNDKKSLIVILKSKNVNIEKEISNLEKRTNIEKLVYIHGRRFQCSLQSDKNSLALKVNERSSEIEVKFIYVYKDFIKLVLDKSNDFNKITIDDNFSVLINAREGKLRQSVDYEINKDENSIIIKANDILSKTKLEPGLYYFELKKGESIYKLTNLNDLIFTKKECVKLPISIGLNKDNEAMSIHPYYTDKNIIAFRLKNGIEITQIDSIKKTPKGIDIRGNLYNRFINDNTPNQITGSIYLNIDDEEVELKYTGIINIKNNRTGRCGFNIHIPNKEIKEKKTSFRKVYSNLKSNLFKYSINSDSIKSICIFNYN